ncbi:MAG TPA: sigma-70 family RNA polymerase sigma factor [Jatrophihabitans sp.]|jgi:RNA polymerase sigma-70 factor (sigma-E family)
MQLDEVIADLMRTSGDRLLRLAYQLCHDRAAAEDLVQEALTRVYGSWLRRAPAVDNREAYVRRAVVNEYLRRRRLRSASEVVTDEVPDRGTDGFDSRVVEHDEVWRALALLPARQRAVMVLRYYEDLPDREIAALIGAKEATVRSLALRALESLRVSHRVEERS